MSLILFSSFRRNTSPIILFKMFTSLWSNFQNRWHFYFTRSSLFLAFTKQECNPCCFLWIGIFKSYFENYSKIVFNLVFSETQHRKVDWRWIHFKWCGLGCSKHTHTRKSLLYFLIVSLNLWQFLSRAPECVQFPWLQWEQHTSASHRR